jgi:hypothetical protein
VKIGETDEQTTSAISSRVERGASRSLARFAPPLGAAFLIVVFMQGPAALGGDDDARPFDAAGLKRDSYNLKFGADDCAKAQAAHGDAVGDNYSYKLPSGETRKFTVCLSAKGYGAEKWRGNDILKAKDVEAELKGELDSVYSGLKANLLAGYKDLNRSDSLHQAVWDHCGMLGDKSEENLSSAIFCHFKFAADLRNDIKNALEQRQKGNEKSLADLNSKYPGVFIAAAAACAGAGAKDDKACIARELGNVQSAAESASGEFRKALVLNSWIGTLDKDLSRKNKNVAVMIDGRRQSVKLGMIFPRLNKYYGSKYLAGVDFDDPDQKKQSQGGGTKNPKSRSRPKARAKSKANFGAGSAQLTGADIDAAKKTAAGRAAKAQDAIAELLKTLGAKSKPVDPEKLKAIADQVHDLSLATRLLDHPPKCTEELKALGACKKGEDFDLYDAYDAGSLASAIGGGQKPKCPAFLQEGGYCAGGTKYDISRYRAQKPTPILEKVSVSALVSGVRTYPLAERVDTPNMSLGSTNIVELERGVYEATKPQLQDDLLAFMADLWVDKYLEASNIYSPENPDQYLGALDGKLASLSCLSPETRNRIGKRKTRLAKNAKDMVKFLSPDPDSVTEKKARYVKNLSNGAQCMGALMNNMLSLRDELGLDTQMVTTLREEEAKMTAKLTDKAGTAAATAATTAKSVLMQMAMGPVGTLMYKWLERFPLFNPTEYAKKPCSMIAIAANEPLYRVGDRVYDPMKESVPDGVKENSERVARAMVCGQQLQDLHSTTEQLGDLLGAYPELGLTQDDKDAENMGYRKLVPKGQNGLELPDARAEKWLAGGKHGPCMSAFLKDPKDLKSGPSDPSADAKARASNLIADKQGKMLGTFLKELGKVCDCESKPGVFSSITPLVLSGMSQKGAPQTCRPNSAVLGQIVSDPSLMKRFYSCQDTHFSALLNFHHNAEPDPVSPAGKTSAKFLTELDAQFKSLDARDKRISSFIQEPISETACKERHDVSPLICYMWGDDRISERMKEIRDGAIEIAFLALELQGASGLQNAVISNVAGNSTKTAIRQSLLKQAIQVGKTYGKEAAIGAGIGLGVHRLTDDSAKRRAQAEMRVALSNVGVTQGVREQQGAVKELEAINQEPDWKGILIQGAVQGVIFKKAMGEHAHGADAKAENAAVRLGEELRDFSNAIDEPGFRPGVESIGQARERARRSGDANLLKALDKFDKRINEALAKAPPKARDALKSLPIREVAAHLDSIGTRVEAHMKLAKAGFATEKVQKLSDAGARSLSDMADGVSETRRLARAEAARGHKAEAKELNDIAEGTEKRLKWELDCL